MRALERDPDKRYKSAGEMGDELETLVLRKGYSTRALARKARELADQEPPADKVRPTPLVVEVPDRRQRDVDGHRRRIDGSCPRARGRAPTATRPRRGTRGRWQIPAVALACLFVGAHRGRGVAADRAVGGGGLGAAAARPRRRRPPPPRRPRRRPPRPCAWRWIRRRRARR